RPPGEVEPPMLQDASKPASTSAGASATSSSAATTTSTAAASAAAGRPAPPSTIAALLALGRPIVLAHTGGEDEYPGSTLFAYGESAAAGVDMLDLNVMLTADGVLVVQHDDSVDRLTNGTGKVGEMSYASLSALDNAYWFTADGVGPGHPDEAYVYRGMRTGAKPPPPGDAPDDFAIPRFSDLVTRFPEMTLNVEIEGSGAPAAAAAAELAKELRDLDREDAAVVTSFDDATVDVFRTLAPNVEVTPGLGASAAWVLSGTTLPDGMRILQLPPRFGPTAVLTPASIAAAHGAGYAIWVWPNDRALENRVSYEQFLDDGIDGLNINVPTEGVAAVAGRLPTSS
ncbi:MAG: glycerophosphoryl diester phosphodiesterase, partial [Ilumatobacteraceae bacterium]|nr:glycerophosphoryl diester phosphodiesterase [Ilumatobacteraceae bacterium]